jgi:hypothetical protein
MSVHRCATALVLAACIQIAVQAQTLESISILRSSVLTDSQGNPKAIHLEFQITTAEVVGKVRLFHRQSGKVKYYDQELKLNQELLYEASVPYAERVEYYLTVRTEKGTAFALGSSGNPQVLQSEGLPRSIEAKQKSHKRIVITTIAIIVGLIAAGLGAGKSESGSKTTKTSP